MNGKIFDAADLNKVLKVFKGYEQVLNKVKIYSNNGINFKEFLGITDIFKTIF